MTRNRQRLVWVLAVATGIIGGIYWPEWWHLGDDSTYTMPVDERDAKSTTQTHWSKTCKKCGCISGYMVRDGESLIWFPTGCCCGGGTR